jgi:plastocyanin
MALLLGCGQSASRPQSHVVEMRGFAFVPARLQLAAGDTVVWLNRDVVPHTATGDDRAWDSGSIGPGAHWQRVASDTGAHAYVCTFHPTMRGTLVVR